MNCADWETRVALHAGGDLTGAKAVEVEQHLGECSACQLLWSGVRESLAELQAAHGELPAAAHFTAVRGRVMAELERSARPWRRLAWISGVAAAGGFAAAVGAVAGTRGSRGAAHAGADSSGACGGEGGAAGSPGSPTGSSACAAAGAADD